MTGRSRPDPRSGALRRGYSHTPHGQVHWRRAGPDRVDLVLLHWAPASGRMYEGVLSALAEQGVGSVAFDLPGFGQSLRPPVPWGPAQLADCLAAALEGLTTGSVALLGGHLSASVAVEWALADPRRISRLVLDGVYAPTPEENAALLAPYAGLSPRFSEDGAHERFVWRATHGFLHEWNPRFTPGPEHMARVYDAMADYLQMGYDAILAWLEPAEPPPDYDALARIAELSLPLLAFTAGEDALRPSFARVLAANPRAVGHAFAGVHPLGEPGRAREYADVLAGFLGETGQDRGMSGSAGGQVP